LLICHASAVAVRIITGTCFNGLRIWNPASVVIPSGLGGSARFSTDLAHLASLTLHIIPILNYPTQHHSCLCRTFCSPQRSTHSCIAVLSDSSLVLPEDGAMISPFVQQSCYAVPYDRPRDPPNGTTIIWHVEVVSPRPRAVYKPPLSTKYSPLQTFTSPSFPSSLPPSPIQVQK
jgi:hypothetical protein